MAVKRKAVRKKKKMKVKVVDSLSSMNEAVAWERKPMTKRQREVREAFEEGQRSAENDTRCTYERKIRELTEDLKNDRIKAVTSMFSVVGQTLDAQNNILKSLMHIVEAK